MKVKSIAECSKGSILQIFRPALSDGWSLNTILVIFLSGRLRQVLLYVKPLFVTYSESSKTIFFRSSTSL